MLLLQPRRPENCLWAHMTTPNWAEEKSLLCIWLFKTRNKCYFLTRVRFLGGKKLFGKSAAAGWIKEHARKEIDSILTNSMSVRAIPPQMWGPLGVMGSGYSILITWFNVAVFVAHATLTQFSKRVWSTSPLSLFQPCWKWELFSCPKNPVLSLNESFSWMNPDQANEMFSNCSQLSWKCNYL